MAPTHIPLSKTLFARQSTSSDQPDNGNSIPVAAAIAPVMIGIVVLFLLCAFCQRRRSKWAATSGSARIYLQSRGNNEGGVGRDDTQNGEEVPPAYTSVAVPPPAYSPDQPPLNHDRTEQESNNAENNNRTSTRENPETLEVGKGSEQTA